MKAQFIKDIKEKDLYGNDITLSIFQHENNGVFAIDASYIESLDEEEMYIPDPFNYGSPLDLIFDED